MERRLFPRGAVIAALLGLVLGARVFAQNVGAVDPGVVFQMSPESVYFNFTAERFRSDVDKYLDVTAWSGVQMEKFFAFAGGTATGLNPNFQLGAAMPLAGGLLGLYFSGDIITGSGQETKIGNQTTSDSSWGGSNNLAIIYGNPGFGAFRLDLLLGGDTITTLQWGHSISLGGITLLPSAAIGLRWWDSDSSGSGSAITTESTGGDVSTASITINGASYGLIAGDGALYGKLGVVALLQSGWAFNLSWDLVVDLGAKSTTTISGVGSTTMERNGGVWDKFVLGASRTFDLTEQLSFSFAPTLQLMLFGWNAEWSSSSSIPGSTPASSKIDYSGLEFMPVVSLGISYALKPSLVFFTGAAFSLVDYRSFSTEVANNSRTDWTLAGLAYTNSVSGKGNILVTPNIGLGMKFEPVEGFNLELGLQAPLELSPFAGRFGIDLTNWQAKLLLSYRK